MNKKSDNISHGKPSAGLNPLKASQPSDTAKIRTDVEETKSRLTALTENGRELIVCMDFLRIYGRRIEVVDKEDKGVEVFKCKSHNRSQNESHSQHQGQMIGFCQRGQRGRMGAPGRTKSVLSGAFWRVFDADRTVDVLSGTLGGNKFVKLPA